MLSNVLKRVDVFTMNYGLHRLQWNIEGFFYWCTYPLAKSIVIFDKTAESKQLPNKQKVAQSGHPTTT
jgi:hypothetical protein